MKGIAVCADMWLFLFQSTHLDTQSLDSTQEACDSPLCKGSFRACKNDWSMLSKHSIYIHASLGLKKTVSTPRSSRGRCSDTSTVAKFTHRHRRQFCLGKLRNIPLCCLFSLSLSLSLSPCILLSLSHLSHFGLWIQTDGRQTSFSNFIIKVTLNRTCSPLAPGGLQDPRASSSGAFQKWRKEKVFNTKKVGRG